MDIGGDASAWSIRTARAVDADFLLDMTIEAVNWRPRRRVTRRQVLETPGLAHYSRGWPRPGDLGLIAMDDRRQPIGAAWLRTFDATDPGFGFVAPDVPEVTVAVVPMRRGRGVGRGLLEALLARAEAAGIRQVSISVEHGNAAASLYTSLGFVPVPARYAEDSEPLAATLVLRLGPDLDLDLDLDLDHPPTTPTPASPASPAAAPASPAAAPASPPPLDP